MSWASLRVCSGFSCRGTRGSEGPVSSSAPQGTGTEERSAAGSAGAGGGGSSPGAGASVAVCSSSPGR